MHKQSLLTSNLTIPSFQGDPIIFNKVLLPHLETTFEKKDGNLTKKKKQAMIALQEMAVLKGL